MGNKSLKENSPPGFASIYDRLMEKLSLSLYLNLKGVRVFVCVKGTKELSYKKTLKSIKIDGSVLFEDLILFLKQTGYQRVEGVVETKQFCVKGGIVDFYSPIYQYPVRVYFYDDPAKFVFYNLSTGLPKNENLKEVYLNKNSDKVVVSLLEDVLQKNNFMAIDVGEKEQKNKKSFIK